VWAALTLRYGRGPTAYRANAINAAAVGRTAQGIRHYEAVLRVAQLKDRDLAYLSRDNAAVGLLPYYIALLRPEKVVVLAIRGTGSLADLATDVAALPVNAAAWAPPEAGGGAAAFTAHAGVLAAADALWKDLSTHGVLDALLDPPREPAEAIAEEHGRSAAAAAVVAANLGATGWHLVVTGHSLGAGVAARVACRLRSAGRAARCWAFAPPGGLVSRDFAACCVPFVTSVAVGKDAIPRLSLPTLDSLLDGAVVALARCAVPAPAAVVALTLRHLWTPVHLERTLFVDPDAVPPPAAATVAAFRAASRARGGPTLRPELAPPGGLLLVRRLKAAVPGPESGLAQRYDAAWAPPTALLEEGLLVSRRAVTDHFVSTLVVALGAALVHAEDEEA
jgi:sn1-specific diacylglycerol lipase